MRGSLVDLPNVVGLWFLRKIAELPKDILSRSPEGDEPRKKVPTLRSNSNSKTTPGNNGRPNEGWKLWTESKL